jgi:cytosine/adenosine deaminase-related metal-dependent hydrolase
MSNLISPDQDQDQPKSGSKSVVIYGGPLIDSQGNVFSDGAIYVSNGKVISVGDEETVFNQIPKTGNPEAFDALGRLIAPGLINLHQHSGYTLAIGWAEFSPNGNMPPADQAHGADFNQYLDDESIQLSLLLSIMRSIRSGVTTIFELQSSSKSANVLKQMASVIEQSGIRFVLSYGASATNGAAKFLQDLEENQALIRQYFDNKRIRGMFGLQVNSSLSEKLLGSLAEKIGNETGLRIHLGGTPDIEHFNKLGYPGPISFLNEFELINNKTLLDSSVPPSSAELEIIIQKGATLVDAPAALAHNQIGLPSLPIPANLCRGIGTAGYHQDILYALRQVYLIYQQQGFDHRTIMKHIATLLQTNRTIAGRYFAGKPGTLARGANADIVVFDYVPVTPIHKDNYLAHLLFGMSATSVNMVMVNGQFVYNDRSFLTLDEELILDECKKASRRLGKVIGPVPPVAFEDDLD